MVMTNLIYYEMRYIRNYVMVKMAHPILRSLEENPQKLEPKALDFLHFVRSTQQKIRSKHIFRGCACFR